MVLNSLTWHLYRTPPICPWAQEPHLNSAWGFSSSGAVLEEHWSLAQPQLCLVLALVDLDWFPTLALLCLVTGDLCGNHST